MNRDQKGGYFFRCRRETCSKEEEEEDRSKERRDLVGSPYGETFLGIDGNDSFRQFCSMGVIEFQMTLFNWNFNCISRCDSREGSTKIKIFWSILDKGEEKG